MIIQSLCWLHQVTFKKDLFAAEAVLKGTIFLNTKLHKLLPVDIN